MVNVRGYLTGTISSVVLGPCVVSGGALCLMMVRARMWPLKHPIYPDRIVLKGHFHPPSHFLEVIEAVKGNVIFLKTVEAERFLL